MSKKQDTTVIEAMVAACGLSPQWEDDYFDDPSSENRARFLNALIQWFDLKDSHHMFHFNNLEWLDVPSTTVEKALWIVESSRKAAA